MIIDRLNDCPNWCLSGGAVGADLLWGRAASKAGHGVIHFSFGDHKTTAPQDQVVRLNAEILAAADEHCHAANQILKRRFPPRSPNTRDLLRRDYFQIESAESVYAVSKFDKDGQVAGGTAWAVTMFLLKHKMAACNAFLFDQLGCRWYEWGGDWKPIYEPPPPTGIYAGIGSRDLELNGRLAISVLMNYDLRLEQGNISYG